MKKRFLFLPALALGGAFVLLSPPPQGSAFSLIGGGLGITQRDFRVFESFADPSANNNDNFNANFPGWYGAAQAIWKGAVEWGSGPHGDGSGDPNQPTLGDGGANFDFFFAGAASSAGGTNRNIASTVSSCGGGTLAFVETPISNGWRMRFCENVTWSDGPSFPGGGQFDIQGVATHEFGHALGLGHSGVSGATMVASTPTGFPQRSIENDDIAGVQFIYGVKSSAKPVITDLEVNLDTEVVTITGTNFSSSNNEVWFTNGSITSPAVHPVVIVSGVSSTGGGTQIVLSVPAAAGNGDVAVHANFTGNDSLSNAWPLALEEPPPPPDPLTLSGISPEPVEVLVPGTAETVTITGTGFDGTVVLDLDFTSLPTSSFTVVNSETITVDMPQVNAGTHFFGIEKGAEAVIVPLEFVAPADPVLQVGTGDPGNPISGTLDLVLAGPPGDLHYVFYSSSNVASKLLPYACLDIGNVFQDLQFYNAFTIDSTGWTSDSVSIAGAAPGTFYMQSATLSQGLPFADSNVQSAEIVP